MAEIFPQPTLEQRERVTCQCAEDPYSDFFKAVLFLFQFPFLQAPMLGRRITRPVREKALAGTTPLLYLTKDSIRINDITPPQFLETLDVLKWRTSCNTPHAQVPPVVSNHFTIAKC